MNWEELAEQERQQVIKRALDEHVSPMLQQDGGGVELVGIEGNIIKIAYQGACVGCPMALHGTLRFIQEMLRSHVYDSLVVVPAIMP